MEAGLESVDDLLSRLHGKQLINSRRDRLDGLVVDGDLSSVGVVAADERDVVSWLSRS